MADFNIKRHDRLPSFKVALTSNGAPLDLTNATGVHFIMKSAATGGAVKVNAVGVIENAAGGVVRYDWVAADTDTAGSYNAEWEIHWPGGKDQTAPTANYHTIDVLADLDNA